MVGQTAGSMPEAASGSSLNRRLAKAGLHFFCDGKNWLEKVIHFSNQFYPGMIRGGRYQRFTAYEGRYTDAVDDLLIRFVD